MTAASKSALPGPATTPKDIQIAVIDSGDVAVVRVQGRGTFLNSVPLKRFAEHLFQRRQPAHFLVDLQTCETMDSTFMGVLASISLHQSREGRSRVELVNANDQIRRLLKTLGLTHFIHIRHGQPASEHVERAAGSLAPAENGHMDRSEQIAHCLEAHKTLVNVDSENEVRFENVIHYLQQSLDSSDETQS